MTYHEAERIALRAFSIAMIVFAAYHTYMVVKEVQRRAALITSRVEDPR